MKTRKSFCYGCRKMTVTVFRNDERGTCYMCGTDKDLRRKKPTKMHHAVLMILLFFIAAASFALVIYLVDLGYGK